MVGPQLPGMGTFGGLSVAAFDENTSRDFGWWDGVVGVFSLGVVHQEATADSLDGLGGGDGAEVEVEVRPPQA
jgi:hypothetical protein